MGLGWGLNERLILCRAIGMLKVQIFFKNDFKIGDRRQDGQGTPTGFSIFEPGSGNVLLLKFLELLSEFQIILCDASRIIAFQFG